MKILNDARYRWFSFTVLILLMTAFPAVAQNGEQFSIDKSPLPDPTGYVNDFAGVIDASTKQQLEDTLTRFKQTSNVEIGIAIVKTTGDRDIFDYSLAVARGWKIGSKDDDNPSALLFVAIDDRKYFTQISRDLEDELPDGLAGSLQRQYLVPEFRKGNYGKGISDTINAYITTIQNRSSGTTSTPVPANTGRRDVSGGTSIFNVICCLGIGFLILVMILSRAGRGGGGRNDRNRWGGGGFGGGGSALPWVIGSILASGSGRSSSGDWGGGGSSGGWGGFGGGGDFGGGGAGGDW